MVAGKFAILLTLVSLICGCAQALNERSFIRPVKADAMSTTDTLARLPSGYAIGSDMVTTDDGKQI